MRVAEQVPEFAVISGAEVHEVLHGREEDLTAVVEATYRAHGEGGTVNPPSYFLRFPDRPSSRIIALPASLAGQDGAAGVDGLKWISSFPGNVASGLPRASAVLILNDPANGYPLVCMESSIISAVRTAASAALAADWLTRQRPRPARLGFVGTGLIARYIHTYLRQRWSFSSVGVHDLDPGYAESFREYCASAGDDATVYERPEDLIRGSDLIVFATSAGVPHVSDPAWFSHAPVVLHVSLRDLAPEVILEADNVVDDVDHCLRAETSVHLAEQRAGDRGFLSGTLYDVMTGACRVRTDAPVVFSPFGLGVLDLAVGRHVYDEVRAAGRLRTIDDFFFELRRHGSERGT